MILDYYFIIFNNFIDLSYWPIDYCMVFMVGLIEWLVCSLMINYYIVFTKWGGQWWSVRFSDAEVIVLIGDWLIGWFVFRYLNITELASVALYEMLMKDVLELCERLQTPNVGHHVDFLSDYALTSSLHWSDSWLTLY